MRLLVRVDLAMSVRGAHTCIKAIEGCIKAFGLAGRDVARGERTKQRGVELLAGLAVGWI